MSVALVDTGPLVALFVRKDPDHARVAAFLRDFRGTLLTTLPVLTEVCHFLTPQVALRAMRWVDAGGTGLVDVPPDELREVIGLMEKYVDRPMDLADASLVWLAGRAGVREILTLDAADFGVFRTRDGKAFKNLLGSGRASR